MTEIVPLVVPLPAHLVGRLTEIAAGMGMTAEQWLGTQARSATLSREISDDVVRLYLRGMTDAEIANRLDLTNAQVSQRRRRFGFPANKKSSYGPTARRAGQG